MEISYNKKQLIKHGLTERLVDEVLQDCQSEVFDLGLSLRGNPRAMYVGWINDRSKLLEIGVEFISDNHDHVFHAMLATKQYIHYFNKRKRAYDQRR